MYYKYQRNKIISLKIEEELLEKIKRWARHEKISTSEFIRRKLKDVIDNEIIS